MAEIPKKDPQWFWYSVQPTRGEIKKILSICVQVGVLMVFTHHVYTFGGRTYVQVKGGPIGLRLTGCAAKGRMVLWAREVLVLFRKS